MTGATEVENVLVNGTTQCIAPPEEATVFRRGSFKPQIAVRLVKGVVKSVAEGRILEIEVFLHSNCLFNWRSCKIPTESPLSEVVTSLCVGCPRIADGEDLTSLMKGFKIDCKILHFYRPSEDGALSQELSLDGNSEESTVGSQLWNLPCIEFEQVWENLFYSTNLKNELMSYVYSLVNLSSLGADMNVITVNRLIILLGPPGTGKTSLCRGLTQHLSIRLNHRFPRAVMFEINSHSLFSKWFSESGKLVQKMFDQIDDLAEDKKCMVFVLIDEVESLGMSRESSSSRGDPADSIRAVNALLTQIDRIRRRENVLILCTSNLEKCLDSALVDRTDLMRHVGQPSQIAMYSILRSCVTELQRIGVVTDMTLLSSVAEIGKHDGSPCASQALWEIAKEAIGLSGRAVRQLPALVLSMAEDDTMSLEECLNYVRLGVAERKSRKA